MLRQPLVNLLRGDRVGTPRAERLTQDHIPRHVVTGGLEVGSRVLHGHGAEVPERDHVAGYQFRQLELPSGVSLTFLVEGNCITFPTCLLPVPLTLCVVVDPPHPRPGWMFIHSLDLLFGRLSHLASSFRWLFLLTTIIHKSAETSH